ncbi:uncharacterized protein LOC116302688 [Actinia tenebrosa]|uniref:Uncharacterized protein LOC116302688 n=1 Tax=Actinia tenebrosa TaxID=6105 RepID=A0A6P8ILQ3_ACTTE|nr:uncharacterized protein LOC116302688 [Actinia tenebrosa]
MAGLNEEVLDMARGLIESRVVVKRPPSAAQRRAYHATPRGPPIIPKEKRARPSSAKARLSTEHDVKNTTAIAVPPRPPWRPFTRESSLSKLDTTGFLDTQQPEEVGVKIKREEEETKNEKKKIPSIYQSRNLPEGLSALSEWLTEKVPPDWAQGYSPESSFVFLPCLQSMNEQDLPCVPVVQEPDEELSYTPVPQIQIYKPPKPRLKFSQDSAAGLKQNSKSSLSSGDDETVRPKHLRMYNKDGELIHDIYRGKRTEEIIRQEIRDLERLLQGIGNPYGSSIVVRYQHDINHLQEMVKSTLEGYTFPDDERCVTPVAATLQEDLVNYPAKHDEIMASICKRRDECIEELAVIERKILHGKS